MKLTKTQLKRIIKEELGNTLRSYKIRMDDGEYEHNMELKGATSAEIRSDEYVKTLVIDGKIELDFPYIKGLDILE